MATNYEILTGALEKCVRLLQSLNANSTPTNRQRIFYANLVEGVKLSEVIRHLTKPVNDHRLLSTESVEALTRLLFERSLLVRQLEKFEGEEPFLRFLKTSHKSMKDKWSAFSSIEVDDSSSHVPPYRNMADKVDPSGESAQIYSQLSHLAHPRTSIPYTVAESTQCKARNITPLEFFELRLGIIVPIAASALDQICDVAGRELAALRNQR